jgi:hypothetical protein
MDTMVVMRTAPTQSWANPVERVMSILNLGLQGVALAREEMVKEYETEFKKCNGMNVVWNLAQEYMRMTPTVAIEQEVVTEHVESVAEVYVSRVVEGEDAEPQQHPPSAKESNDSAGSGADDEISCKLVAEENVIEKGTESLVGDDLVVRMSQLDPEEEDDWLGSDADDEAVREVLAVEEGNEPSIIDDPVIARSNFIDHDDDDGDWLGSDVDDEGVHKKALEENEDEVQRSVAIDLTDDVDNPFIDAYIKSIKKARDMIAGQWRECTRDKKSLGIQCPATTVEVIALFTRPFDFII